MRTWILRLVLLASIMAIGVWLGTYFFPNPERAIRKRLNELAKSASFGGREGELAKVNNAALFSSYFTTDVEIAVDLPGRSPLNFDGREQLLQAAVMARAVAGSLSVEFPDITVTVGSDKTSATANATAKARAGSERDTIVQELKFMLKKVGREWLIYKVETVKTLSDSRGCRLASGKWATRIHCQSLLVWHLPMATFSRPLT